MAEGITLLQWLAGRRRAGILALLLCYRLQQQLLLLLVLLLLQLLCKALVCRWAGLLWQAVDAVIYHL
jgi:hypothetical protein